MDEKKIDELSNEICMGAIDYTTERDIKPHRNGVHGHIAERLVKQGYGKQKQGCWIYSNMGCVINCSNCGERLELCYPDGTEIRETAYCPFCGAKMENKIEITEKAIRKNAEQETAFVDLLNQETKELSESFDSYLFYHGYRKESDTAREILECLRFLIEERNCVGGYDLEDETIDGTIFVEILNELKERYGVEVE